MPLTVQMNTLETPPPGTIAEENMVDHPLSPTQEQLSDTIVGHTINSCMLSYFEFISFLFFIPFEYSIQNFHLVWIVYHHKHRLSIQMFGNPL